MCCLLVETDVLHVSTCIFKVSNFPHAACHNAGCVDKPIFLELSCYLDGPLPAIQQQVVVIAKVRPDLKIGVKGLGVVPARVVGLGLLDQIAGILKDDVDVREFLLQSEGVRFHARVSIHLDSQFWLLGVDEAVLGLCELPFLQEVFSLVKKYGGQHRGEVLFGNLQG